MKTNSYDAVVIGAGPNGLAAAITLARQGCRVLVVEAKATAGGGTRTAQLTLPGFQHDLCSAIHPLALASPFFRSLPLAQNGLEWAFSPAALAHPFDDAPAFILEGRVEDTAVQLGKDGPAYIRLFAPLARQWKSLADDLLGPFPFPPQHPILMAKFGLAALQPANFFARMNFQGKQARGAFAGLAAHSLLPLESLTTAAFGLMLGTFGHAVGWPVARGGSQNIAKALAACLAALGGELRTETRVHSMADLPPARAYLFDVTPRQLIQIAGDRLPAGYRRRLSRYRYGPGVFKLDYALSGPVPWKDPACRRAATLHLGGTLEEISASESAAWRGQHAARPTVLFAQQSLFDPSRAPAGQHTAWAYCHVPHGSQVDMTGPIERQIERFAPGFTDLVLARSTHNCAEMEAENPNYVGGDINAGAGDLRQRWTRPVARLNPYTTPARDIFICSASTPPGGGVHGMCGYFAAQAALRSI